MSESTPKPAPPPKGCELLRENIFEDTEESVLLDDDELLKRREPTMLRKGNLLLPATRGEKKYTVVFDLDETVVYARDGPLYARAYLRELLRAIKDEFEVIVWTAGERDYAKNVLEEINEDHIIQHLIYRDNKWFDEQDYTKDLKKLARDLDHTIIIENTPDCVRANPQNGIIVEDFEVLQYSESDREGSVTPQPPLMAEETTATASQSVPLFSTQEAVSQKDAGVFPSAPDTLPAERGGTTPSSSQRPKRQHTDRTLYLLREVLLDLARSDETVPVFLTRCEMLSQQVVIGSDGLGIPIYHLGTRRRRKDAGTPRKVVKQNRDKVTITKEPVPELVLSTTPQTVPTEESTSSSIATPAVRLSETDTTPTPAAAADLKGANKRPRTPSSTPPPQPSPPTPSRRRTEPAQQV